jgi:hypothetical protein
MSSLSLEFKDKFVYSLIHADDFISTATHDELIDEVSATLETKYEVNASPVESYLGLNITREEDGMLNFTRKHQLKSLF